MKTMIKNNCTSVFIIVIVFLLILFNMTADNTAKFSLTESAGGRVVEYSPKLSLGAGKYDLVITAKTEEPVDIKISSFDNKCLYEGTVSSRESTISLELTEHENGILITSDSTDAVLTGVTVKSSAPLYSDTLFVALAVLFALFFALWIKTYGARVGNKGAIIIMLFAAVIASYPLFTEYLYYGHDLTFHLWRIEGIADGLRAGQFPVRIHPTHNAGYGYITASVYPELFMYIPAVLRLLGMSLPTAYKSLLFIMNILTALIMYKAAKDITKSQFAGTVASVIYTLSTWRVLNLYARAALGEGLAMTFLPLVILGLYHIIKGDRKKWYILAVAFTCIFQTHVISTVLVAILSVVIALVFVRDIFKETRFIGVLKAIGVTVLLNLWYLVPFVRYYFGLDMLITKSVVNTEFWQNSIIPAELFNIFNDSFGYSQLIDKGIRGNLSLSLGFTISACLALCVWYFITHRRGELENEKFTKVCFICGMFLIFAATSLFPWRVIQPNALINKFAGLVRMPWRFLSIASPLITLAASHILTKYAESKTAQKLTLVVVCAVAAVFMIHFGAAFTTNVGTSIVKAQMPTEDGSIGWDKEYLIERTDVSQLVPGRFDTSKGVSVDSWYKNGTSINMNTTNSTNGGYVEVPLLYYPGYKAKNEDGTALLIECGENNVLRINLDGAEGEISVYYSGFFYFRIAELVSLITMVWLIFGKIIKERKRDLSAV